MRSLAASPTPTLASLSALSPDALKLLALSVPSFLYLLFRMCEMDDADAARCTQETHRLESPVRQRRKSSSAAAAAAAARRRSSGAAHKSPTRRANGRAEARDSGSSSPVKSPPCSVQAHVPDPRGPFVSRHVRAAFSTRTDSGLDVLGSLHPPLAASAPASAAIVGPSP